jgi:predicted permease
MLREFRYGFRSLRRWRVDALAAIVTLAIGIGTATSLFVFLRAASSGQTPRIADVESVGRIYASSRSLNVERAPLSANDAESLLRATATFEAIGAYASSNRAVSRGGLAVVVPVGQITPGFFDVFRVRPARGRLLSAADARSPEPVVVVGEAFWRTHLNAGSPGDMTVGIGDATFTVVGVLPAEFRFPLLGIGADVWMMRGDGERLPGSVSVIARLAKGASWSAAAAELDARARAHEPDRLWTWRVIPVAEDAGRRVGTASAIFLGPALVVLLIGCVNVACMLTARGLDRHVELSVRYALGATRGRLILQLLAEHLLLAGCGGALGYGIAVGILRLIAVSMPAFQAELIPDLSLDLSTLAVALGMSLLAAVLFGTLPAIHASRRDVAPSLKGEPPAMTGRFVGYHARDLVVFVELALAVVLVVVAALWLNLFAELQRVTLRFAAAQIVTVPAAAGAETTVVDAVAAVPGVTGVTLASSLPGGRTAVVQIEAPGGRFARARRVDVQPSFFQTIGLPIVKGRSFESSEANAHAAAAVVSQTLASKLWPGEEPLGATVTVRGATGTAVAVVIGVCADAMTLGALVGTAVMPPEVYLRFDPRVTREPVLLARVDGGAHAFVRPIELALSRNSPDAARATALMDDRQFSTDEGLFLVRLVGAFGLVALGLAASGIFAVLSQSVSQRTMEFGVRMAMGATPRDVLFMVLGREAKLIVSAIGAGAAGTLLVTRVVFADLAAIGGREPWLWAGVLVLCGGCAAAAAALATRRIVRLDPWTVLRRG